MKCAALWGTQGFQSLHGEIVSALLAVTRQPLYALGDVAGRETSLQIAEGREPDIYVRGSIANALAAPGVMVEDEARLSALHIREHGSGDLVTVVEIVSPGNKRSPLEILVYQERRTRLYLARGVNVVEIDLTRSVKRLTDNALTQADPYHAAVLLPGEFARIVGCAFGQPLPRLALPLRAEVVAVELQAAYAQAYRETNLSWHVQRDGAYTEDRLPFASLLSAAQRAQARLNDAPVLTSRLRRCCWLYPNNPATRSSNPGSTAPPLSISSAVRVCAALPNA